MILINNYMDIMREYVEFGGRVARTEYWLFALAQVIVYAALGALYSLVVAFTSSPVSSLLVGIGVMYAMGIFLPCLGLTVRRLHDAGYSGWWTLPALIGVAAIVGVVYVALPGERLALLALVVVGAVVAVVFAALPSERGENRHGADPREAAGAQEGAQAEAQ